MATEGGTSPVETTTLKDGTTDDDKDKEPGFLKRISRAISGGEKPAQYDKWPGDHPYAYTIGDVEVREAPDLKTGKMEQLIFSMTEWPKPSLKLPEINLNGKTEKKEDGKDKKKDKKKKKEPLPVRKVFASFKVKRVSDIDNVEEQFRIKFHIYFNWLPTYKEYMSYIETRESEELEIYDWEPRWYPHLEFMNQIEPVEPYPRWEEYPDEGRFRLQKLRGFFDLICDDGRIYHPDDRNVPLLDRNPIDEFSADRAYFIRAKFDVEMLLSEELELQSFPFDCQDLSVVMRENTRDINISFLPEMRKKGFGSIDPRYSVIDEWDLESARIEFGATNAGSSRSSTTYPMIILRLKMKRRWQVFMWKIVVLMLCIEALAITCFALDPVDEASDRLGLSITLVLTAVAFLHVVKSGLPNVPYLTFLDYYVYSGYLFLMAIMVETAFFAGLDIDVENDNRFMLFCIVYQIVYHLFFFFMSFRVRRGEKLKLVMDSDSIEDDVNLSRPALLFNYTKGSRQGHGDRLLYFKASQAKARDD